MFCGKAVCGALSSDFVLADSRTYALKRGSYDGPVTPDFDQLVASASQCVVFDAGMGDGSPLADLAVLTLRGRPLLGQLRGLLHVRASAGFECMCLGDCTLRFGDDAGLALATVSVHHAVSLRWDG